MRSKIVTACVVLAALVAVAPAAALASPELQTSTGTKVATGTGIKVQNEAAVVYTSGALVDKTCGPANMSGTVLTNSGSLVQVKVESFKLEGGNCASFTFENLPWCLSSSVLGEWVLKGGGCEKEGVSLAYSTKLLCKYQLSAMIGSYTKESSPLKMASGNDATWTLASGGFGCEPKTVFHWFLSLVTSSGGALKIV